MLLNLCHSETTSNCLLFTTFVKYKKFWNYLIIFFLFFAEFFYRFLLSIKLKDIPLRWWRIINEVIEFDLYSYFFWIIYENPRGYYVSVFLLQLKWLQEWIFNLHNERSDVFDNNSMGWTIKIIPYGKEMFSPLSLHTMLTWSMFTASSN